MAAIRWRGEARRRGPFYTVEFGVFRRLFLSQDHPNTLGPPAMTPVQTLAATVTMLAASNLFMTFAWYGHLKHLQAGEGRG